MKRGWWVAIGIVLVAGIYLNAIWVRPLFPTDETRYAEIAREMVVSGDWVTPRLAGLRYFEKPVMTHWLNAAGLRVFGGIPFAVRLPAVLAALFTAAVLWFWGARATRDRRVGWLAAAIWLSSVLPFAISTWVVTDGIFTCFITAALAAFFLGLNGAGGWRRAGWLAAGGAMCGAAFLTKGLLAIALPGLAVAGFLLWERRWRDLATAWLLPLACFLAVVAPWAVAIHGAEPDFWRYFILEEHFARFFNPERGDQHAAPFWFFLPVLIGGLMPWLLLAPCAWQGMGGRWRNALVRFCLLGSGLIFLFLSASSGKLAPYILPIFPLLALPLAIGILGYLDAGRRAAFDWPARVLSWVLWIGAVGFLLYQALGWGGVLPEAAVLYGPGEYPTLLLAVWAVIGWGVALHLGWRAVAVPVKLWCWTVGILVVLGAVHFVIPWRFAAPLSPELFYARFQDRVTPDTVLVGRNEQVAALCWSFKRTDVLIYENHEELDYGAAYADAGKRELTPEEFLTLLRESPHKVVIGLTSKRVMGKLPPSRYKVWENKLLYQEYDEFDR